MKKTEEIEIGKIYKQAHWPNHWWIQIIHIDDMWDHFIYVDNRGIKAFCTLNLEWIEIEDPRIAKNERD